MRARGTRARACAWPIIIAPHARRANGTLPAVNQDGQIPAFRPVPKTGVIFVTTEATKLGYTSRDPEWCNLGQGQPETGPLPGAPARVERLTIDVDDQEYAPVPGI